MGVDMKKVFKYPLELTGVPQQVLMPAGAQVVYVGDQNGTITIWALVDPEAEPLHKIFLIAGTGHPLIRDNVTYLGAVFQDAFV